MHTLGAIRMSEKKEDTKLLKEIRDLLQSIDAREETNELISESNGLIKNAEKPKELFFTNVRQK